MNRGGAETLRMNDITEKVIGACIEIHRTLGPGLLESARRIANKFDESKA